MFARIFKKLFGSHVVHVMTEWEKVKDPSPFVISAMYRCGMVPHRTRHCTCCDYTELELVKWD